MPLKFLVAEARKNTPSLAKKPVSVAQATVQEPPQTPEMQRLDVKRQMAEISEGDKAVAREAQPQPAWKACQYLKTAGDRNLCKQYMSWCAEEKCQQKFMETDFFDFKRHLKGKRPIK